MSKLALDSTLAQSARAVEPHKRLRIRQFSDAQYGEVHAILTDDDPVGKLCVLHGAGSEFIAKVIAKLDSGFVQIYDGRLFPQNRVRGVLFAAVRDMEIRS